MQSFSAAVAPLVHQSCMRRNDKTFLRSKLIINTCREDNFPAQHFENAFFKETSLDTNVAVIPEKLPFPPWTCKPGKYYPCTTVRIEVKYANTCTGFFGVKVLTNERQVF